MAWRAAIPPSAQPEERDKTRRRRRIAAVCAVVVALLTVLILRLTLGTASPDSPAPGPVGPKSPSPDLALPASGARQLASVRLGDQASSVAVSPDNTKVWVAQDLGVTVIHSATNMQTRAADMALGAGSVAVAADGRVYAARLDGFLSVLDGATERQLSIIKLVEARQRVVQVAAGAGGRMYAIASGRDNTLIAVDASGAGSVLARIGVENEPRTLAVSPDGQRVYVGLLHAVLTVDAATNRVISRVPTATDNMSLAVAPDGSRAYAYALGHNLLDSTTITVLDGHTGGKLGDLRPAARPTFGLPARNAAALAVSPSGRYLFASVSGGPGQGEVTVVDTWTGAVADHISVSEAAPGAIAVAPNGTRIYVLSNLGQSVLVIDPARYQ